MSRAVPRVALVGLLLVLAGCGPGDPRFHGDERPQRLSEWNLFTVSAEALTPNPASLHFRPANTLFTDYAHKLRTLWIPDGESIGVVDGELDYPVGTILTKTFYYPVSADGDFRLTEDRGEADTIDLTAHRLLETRLLVRKTNGWDAFPYVWNADQTEAFLRLAGASMPATLTSATGSQSFTYFVPNENQCSGCHQTEHPDGGMHPLGAIARQLNHGLPSDEGARSQLENMLARGWLEVAPGIAPIPVWTDEQLPLDQRARAYLDMNCGHCHNPSGPADTSALLLDGFSHNSTDMGRCKPPVAAGGGSGNLQFGIVPGQPDLSILLFRMESTNPGTMMPELGRTLVHDEGVELIRTWIAQMDGEC